MAGHGQKLTRKQEVLIACLLSEPTRAAAAKKAKVGEATVGRWMRLGPFQRAYRRARREVVDAAIGKLQAATTDAANILHVVVLSADAPWSLRVKAAIAVQELAFKGLAESDLLAGPPEAEDGEAATMDTAGVVRILACRIRQLDAADMPVSKKAALTATLADALLRAISIDQMEQRLRAVEAALAAQGKQT